MNTKIDLLGNRLLIKKSEDVKFINSIELSEDDIIKKDSGIVISVSDSVDKNIINSLVVYEKSSETIINVNNEEFVVVGMEFVLLDVDNMKPHNDFVLIKQNQPEEFENNLELSADAIQEKNSGICIEISDNVKNKEILGKNLVYDKYSAIEISLEENNYVIIDYKNIIGIL